MEAVRTQIKLEIGVEAANTNDPTGHPIAPHLVDPLIVCKPTNNHNNNNNSNQCTG